MSRLTGEQHDNFVALSVEWATLYNSGKAARTKEEKDRCRHRIRQINQEQQQMLDEAEKKKAT